jgi:CRISPR/Cas system-associated endonuclease Cas1
VVYVGLQGSRVRVEAGRLVVESADDQELLDVPSGQVERLVCFGAVGVSAGFRSWALANGVDQVFLSRCGSYPDRDQLMGVEGAAAREYFAALGAIMPAGLAFAGRSRQPPLDVVNAALSFGWRSWRGGCLGVVRGWAGPGDRAAAR